MSLRETAPGIFYSDEPHVAFGERDIDWLLVAARSNDKQRARLCAHSDTTDPVHEMLICLLQTCYIRPHAHRKAESAHAIRGVCDLILFSAEGLVSDVLHLNADAPHALRFVRLPPLTFHTQIIRSPYFVFHETTRGPFDTADTIFPDWSPGEQAPERISYMQELDNSVQRFSHSRGTHGK